MDEKRCRSVQSNISEIPLSLPGYMCVCGEIQRSDCRPQVLDKQYTRALASPFPPSSRHRKWMDDETLESIGEVQFCATIVVRANGVSIDDVCSFSRGVKKIPQMNGQTVPGQYCECRARSGITHHSAQYIRCTSCLLTREMVHADKGERGKHPEVLLTSSMDARLRSERYFVLIFVEVAAHAQTTVRTDDGPLGLSPTRRPPPTAYRLPNLINCRLPTLSNRGDKLSIIKYGFSLAQYSTGRARAIF